PQQYQQNTLLLEAIEQAENIINIIYYRRNNIISLRLMRVTNLPVQ
ncbi:EscE/YscE/SsaE family type III secretion system needle protein co-chaperone, partial [Salmonella enterica]